RSLSTIMMPAPIMFPLPLNVVPLVLVRWVTIGVGKVPLLADCQPGRLLRSALLMSPSPYVMSLLAGVLFRMSCTIWSTCGTLGAVPEVMTLGTGGLLAM